MLQANHFPRGSLFQPQKIFRLQPDHVKHPIFVSMFPLLPQSPYLQAAFSGQGSQYEEPKDISNKPEV